VVINGRHAGKTLLQLWHDAPELFGADGQGRFPLLVKMIDARDWLSVQVHPTDRQAERLKNEAMGKHECWYVVAAQPGAEVILGHTAASTPELHSLIDAGRWDDLLLRRKVTAGDFIHVPPGAVHAIGPGVLICEVQQSCDITYRVHDFDRVDMTGRPRQLHVDQAKQVITAPFDPAPTQTLGDVELCRGGSRQTLASTGPFEVTKLVVDGEGFAVNFSRFPRFELCSVIAGRGWINWRRQRYPLKAGDHFIVLAGSSPVTFDGEFTAICAHASQGAESVRATSTAETPPVSIRTFSPRTA
jgi:mannose-6-phosphate isomerase